MSLESFHRPNAEEAAIPHFDMGFENNRTVQLPDGRVITLTNITFKGPIENATYEGTTEVGKTVRIATTTREGITSVVGVWADGEAVYTAPTIH
jgi:hypothetical protein